MKNAAKLLRNNFPTFRASLDNLKAEVLVGVPAEKTGRKAVKGDPAEPMNNATLAYIHDNGSPAANIPARPFMRPGIMSVKANISIALEKGARGAIHGEASAVDKALNIAGMTAQSAIRGKINEGIAPELAESTIAARKAKGFQGEKPLIRTAQMRNSINYVVREKK